MLRGATHRYDATLDGTLRSAVVPYGYTITIWASGAYLINLRGVPGMLEAFAFVSGALLAFALLASVSQRRLHGHSASNASELLPDGSHPIFAAGLHIAAVGLALLGAWAVDSSLGPSAWFFGSFVVTLIYLSLASLELALAVEIRQRQIGFRTARGRSSASPGSALPRERRDGAPGPSAPAEHAHPARSARR